MLYFLPEQQLSFNVQPLQPQEQDPFPDICFLISLMIIKITAAAIITEITTVTIFILRSFLITYKS